MVEIKYTAFGRKRSINVPWSVIGNAMVAKKYATSTQGSYVEMEDEPRQLISSAWKKLPEEKKEKIRNFISAGL